MLPSSCPLHPPLRALYLGRLSFADGFRAQSTVLQRLRAAPDDPAHQRLLLLEHNPVFTCGLRHADPANDTSATGQARLRALGAEFYRCNRGGLLTFHGPGQLMAYPLLLLRQHFAGPPVRAYVDALQRTVVRLCDDDQLGLGLPPAEITNDVGVWMRGKKMAAIGVSVKRYISAHGVAVNCDVDLAWFDHIVPCGLVGRRATSLSAEVAPRRVSHLAALPAFVRAFETVFDCELSLCLDVAAARREVGLSADASVTSSSDAEML